MDHLGGAGVQLGQLDWLGSLIEEGHNIKRDQYFIFFYCLCGDELGKVGGIAYMVF